MTPGIINYEDCKGGGQELLKKQTIDEFLNSLVGAPLTIGHVPTNLTTEELVDRVNGTVDRVGFDVETGWHFCEGPVDTDQARQHISDGWGVSVGMRVPKDGFGPGGMWLNNRYDREIKKIAFHHVALVEPGLKPRIDESVIRLNSTSKPKMNVANIAKLIKKALIGGKETEQTSDLPLTTKLDIGGGKSATLGELIEFDRSNHVHAVMSDDYIEHEGVRYNCGDLVKHYRDKMAGGTVADRTNAIERACVTDTPEQKAARDAVFAAANAIKPLKAALDSATDEVDRINALPTSKPEDKTGAGTKATEAKAAYDAAFAKGAEATDRFNSLIAKKVEETAEAKAAREASERATRDREAESARVAEEARLHATRSSGAASFAILANAAERGTPRTVFVSPKSGRDAKLALGRKLAGSGRFTSGKN